MPRLFSMILGVLLAAHLALVGCCTDPVNGKPYFCFSDMSPHEEAELGSRYAPGFVAHSGGKYPDAELHKYLNRIVVGKLAANSHRPQLPWGFVVLNTSDVNAFALPGGKVFVTRGLLALIETEAQFAHLMGHEVGHVSHKHALRGQGRAALLGILVTSMGFAERGLQIILTDPDDPLYVSGTAGAVASIPFLEFNRQQEIESDTIGVDYAVQNGYDPRESVKTFRAFAELKKKLGPVNSALLLILSTHPMDATRIRNLERYIQSLELDLDALVVSTPGWDEHINRIKAAHEQYEKYDEALKLIEQSRREGNRELLGKSEELLQEGRAALPDHAPFHFGLALIDAQLEDPDAARAHIDVALRLDPNLFDARLLSAVIHRSVGQDEEALADLAAAYQISPASPYPCFQLGETNLTLGRKEPAKSWFEKALHRSADGTQMRKLCRARLKDLS